MLLKKRLDLHFSFKKGISLFIIGVILLSISGYIAMSPPTYTTTQQVNQTSYQTHYTHESTTIQTNSSLYESGTTLENKTVYYQNLHPILEINTQTTQTPTSSKVSAEMVATQGRDSNIIWTQDIDTTHKTLNYNESTNEIAVNITEIKQSFEEKQSELPAGTTLQYQIKNTAYYNYNGNNFSQEANMTISFNSARTYQVTSNGGETIKSDSEQRTQPIPAQSVTVNGSSYNMYGSIGIIIAVLLLSMSGYILYGYKFDERTHEEILYQYHLEKYKDWITFGRPLTDPQLRSDAENKVLVNSLKGLIQISIDSDGRVVYSQDLKRFYIFINQNIYFFKPPTSKSPLELDSSIPNVPEIDDSDLEDEETFDDDDWQTFEE